MLSNYINQIANKDQQQFSQFNTPSSSSNHDNYPLLQKPSISLKNLDISSKHNEKSYSKDSGIDLKQHNDNIRQYHIPNYKNKSAKRYHYNIGKHLNNSALIVSDNNKKSTAQQYYHRYLGQYNQNIRDQLWNHYNLNSFQYDRSFHQNMVKEYAKKIANEHQPLQNKYNRLIKTGKIKPTNNSLIQNRQRLSEKKKNIDTNLKCKNQCNSYIRIQDSVGKRSEINSNQLKQTIIENEKIIGKYIDKIDDLEEKNRIKSVHLEKMRKTVLILEQANLKLLKEKQEIDNNNIQLKRDNTHIKGRNSTLKRDKILFSKDNLQLQKQKSQLQQKYNKIQEKYSGLELSYTELQADYLHLQQNANNYQEKLSLLSHQLEEAKINSKKRNQLNQQTKNLQIKYENIEKQLILEKKKSQQNKNFLPKLHNYQQELHKIKGAMRWEHKFTEVFVDMLQKLPVNISTQWPLKKQVGVGWKILKYIVKKALKKGILPPEIVQKHNLLKQNSHQSSHNTSFEQN